MGISALQIARYGIMALIAWSLAYGLFASRWFHRKIIQSWPDRRDVLREIGCSLSNACIFGLVGSLTLQAARQGWMRIYFDLSQYSWNWLIISILLTIPLHDTYFYWTRR